jgi:WD40 repeat protein
MYQWDWFGDCKDRITKHTSGIESLVKYDEETLIAGCEDGWVRFYDLVGHKFRVFENHADDLDDAMAVEEMSVSRCRRILASVSDDCCVRFYDISGVHEYLEADKTETEVTLEQVVGDKATSQRKQVLKTKNTQFFEDI